MLGSLRGGIFRADGPLPDKGFCNSCKVSLGFRAFGNSVYGFRVIRLMIEILLFAHNTEYTIVPVV